MDARRGLGLEPDSARGPPDQCARARLLAPQLRATSPRSARFIPALPGRPPPPPDSPSGAPAAAMMIVYNTHRSRRGRREKASWLRLAPAAAPNLAQPGRKQVEVSMETRLLRFPGPAPATL